MNDAPAIEDLTDTLSYRTTYGSRVIDSDITLVDPDSAEVVEATIQITGHYQAGEDTLGIDAGDLLEGVTAKWDSSTGTLTLTGSATQAAYQSMFEHVKYANSSDNPNTDDRTVTWTVQDDDGGMNVPQTSTIEVTAVNDAPRSSGVPNPPGELQDFGQATYDISSYFWDPDGPGMTFELGTVTYRDGLVLSGVAIDSDTGVITFSDSPSSSGSVDVQVRASDGLLDGEWQTFTFSVDRITQPLPQTEPGHQPDQGDAGLPLFSTSTLSFPGGEEAPVSSTVAEETFEGHYSGGLKALSGASQESWQNLPGWALLGGIAEGELWTVNELSGLFHEHKKNEAAELFLGLEQFIAKQKEWFVGTEHEDIRLSFNARDMELVDLFSSHPATVDDWPNHVSGNEIGPSHGSLKPFLQGKTLLVGLDDVRVFDLLMPGAESSLLERLNGSSAMAPEHVIQMLDLSQVSLLDAVQGSDILMKMST